MKKKNLKRIAILLLSLVLVLGLLGCGSTDKPGRDPDRQQSQVQDDSKKPDTGKKPGKKPGTETGTEDKTSSDGGSGSSSSSGSGSASSGGSGSSSSGSSSSGSGSGSSTSGSSHISDGTQTGQDKYHTDPVPEGKPLPQEPENTEIESTTGTCYLSISCATILDNMDQLEEGKESFVPADGMILYRQAVTFHKGESVFDVLQRVTRENRIHMEFAGVDESQYGSAYIEGINNLYEFDCGSLSGWMYCVNTWYPNYGVSRYVVQEGDVIEFNYTCDLGRDLPGGDWMAQHG